MCMHVRKCIFAITCMNVQNVQAHFNHTANMRHAVLTVACAVPLVFLKLLIMEVTHHHNHNHTLSTTQS